MQTQTKTINTSYKTNKNKPKQINMIKNSRNGKSQTNTYKNKQNNQTHTKTTNHIQKPIIINKQNANEYKLQNKKQTESNTNKTNK